MDKKRIEAFSDAILAIIVTIMALELQLPQELTLSGFVGILPMVFVYIASFLQIMTVWLYYHELFQLLDQMTFRVFVANSVWLLTASLVPLATRAVGQYSGSFSALLFYILILGLWDVAWVIMATVLLKSTSRQLSLDDKRIPYRWAKLYAVQLLVILLVGYLVPSFIPFGPLLMIVNVIYGFLSDRK
ncbi:TMEM175 family protein [Streptococcus marmotae]|uniref:TMEM175 family protein n=1 Tax=Streptococcus marmotae TaxID=1825069 RepID=UPI000829A19F|nr:TMEM175 family protein [Streptococcus marmotae]